MRLQWDKIPRVLALLALTQSLNGVSSQTESVLRRNVSVCHIFLMVQVRL